MYQEFQCIVFLADGKHISQTETCKTASEAIARANAWVALGHIAKAFLMVADIKKLELYHYPLS